MDLLSNRSNDRSLRRHDRRPNRIISDDVLVDIVSVRAVTTPYNNAEAFSFLGKLLRRLALRRPVRIVRSRKVPIIETLRRYSNDTLSVGRYNSQVRKCSVLRIQPCEG